jgi:hypothetical protein
MDVTWAMNVHEFLIWQCRDVVISIAFQKLLAGMQPKMICAADLLEAWQVSHVASPTIPFFFSMFILHWIPPWESSHAKNFTLGGPLLFQTNLAHVSGLDYVFFMVPYVAVVSS